MQPQKQGYLYVLITMCIWGGFTLAARLSASWGISAWDLTALRFLLAFAILMPILIYKKDTAFLWKKEPFILAMLGGVIYCLSAYSAFHYAPAAHAAIFLNGCIPLCTAAAAYVLFQQAFDRHTWISLIIMLASIGAMSLLLYMQTGQAFGLGDLLTHALQHQAVAVVELDPVVARLRRRRAGLPGAGRLAADGARLRPGRGGACASRCGGLRRGGVGPRPGRHRAGQPGPLPPPRC